MYDNILTSPQAIYVSCKDHHDFCQVRHGARSASIDNAGLLKTMIMVVMVMMVMVMMVMTMVMMMMAGLAVRVASGQIFLFWVECVTNDQQQ